MVRETIKWRTALSNHKKAVASRRGKEKEYGKE